MISSHIVDRGSFHTASVSGQLAMEAFWTASPAWPFRCWPPWASLPFMRGLEVEQAAGAYLAFLRAAHSSGVPFDTVLWGMAPCLHTDRVDELDDETGLLAPVLQHPPPSLWECQRSETLFSGGDGFPLGRNTRSFAETGDFRCSAI